MEEVKKKLKNNSCILNLELKRIDEEIQKDKDRRQETHQQQREAEGRQEQQQEMKEEEHAVPTAVEEVKVYQEELETRKKIDIFAQPSSAEYLRLLKNDTNLLTTESQIRWKQYLLSRAKSPRSLTWPSFGKRAKSKGECSKTSAKRWRTR